MAGLVANGANVIVTVLVARPLGPKGYGVFGRLIGIFLVLAIPGSGLQVAVVRRVTAWRGARQGHRIAPWAHRVRRVGYVSLAVVAVIAVALRWFVADLLKLPAPTGVAEIIIAGTGWALLAIDRGLLQGRRAYGKLARSLCVEGGARTLLTLGLVAAGLGVEGAAIGLLGALVAADLDARWSLSRLRAERAQAVGATTVTSDEEMEVAAALTAPVIPMAGRRQLAVDVLSALGALALLATLQNLDVVIVGREAPDHVGPYTAIAVASKALVFAALVLSGYLLPEAAVRAHRGEHALRQLGAALALLALPAVGLLAVALAVPRTALRLVFGPKLVAAAPAFATLAVAMAALAGAALFTHYLLGVGRRTVVAVLGVTAVADAALLSAAGGRYVDTARANLVCQVALAVVTGAMVWRLHGRDARARAR